MKRKKYLLISLIIISIITIFTINNNVFATGANLNASSTNIEPGDTVNLSAYVTEAASWSLDIQASGGTLNKSNDRTGTTNDGENGNTTVNLGTFTASNEGSYTITLSGSVVNGDNLNITSASGSVIINVKAKEEPQGGNNEQQGGSTEQGGNNEQQGGGTQQGGNNNDQPTEKVPNFTNVNKTVYTIQTTSGIVNLRSTWSTNVNEGKVGVPTGTELTLTGTSTETINGYVWYRVTYNGQTKYVASSLITETKPEEKKPEEKKPDEQKQEEPPKSSNTNLKELKVNIEGLTPAFDAKVKEYTLNVAADVEKIEVTAVTEDEKAKYSVSGNEELKTGENLVKVTVNAEDGTTTIYEIKVTKAAPEGLKLTKLEVTDYELTPKFSSDVFDYQLSVIAVNKLDIVAEASEEKATIEIIGNEELQTGENLVTIMVKSEDGTKTVTYQITVDKKEALVTTNKTTDSKGLNKAIILVAVLIIVAIIGIVIYIIANKKKAKKRSSNDYYAENYNDNDENYNTIQNYEEDDEDMYEEDEDDSNDGNGKNF